MQPFNLSFLIQGKLRYEVYLFPSYIILQFPFFYYKFGLLLRRFNEYALALQIFGFIYCSLTSFYFFFTLCMVISTPFQENQTVYSVVTCD